MHAWVGSDTFTGQGYDMGLICHVHFKGSKLDRKL